MKVYILKGKFDSGRTQWAESQDPNAHIIIRHYTITSALPVVLKAIHEHKDIIFNCGWSEDREESIRNAFGKDAIIEVKEFK